MGADRSQPGNAFTTGFNGLDQQAIIQDTQNNVLAISGSTRIVTPLQITLAAFPAQVALTAITAAQTFISKTFGAGFLNCTGRRFRVRGTLIYSTTAANVATITLALTLGGVTICSITTAATNTTASTNLPVQFEFFVTVAQLGATGTVEAHGLVYANIGTAAATAVAVYADTNTAPSAAVNLLAANAVTVTIAGSAAIPSAQLRELTIELVN